MSFMSRHSPRFSYVSSSPPCPSELLGQSSFWQKDESRPRSRSPRIHANPRSEPQDDLYRYYGRPMTGPGLLSRDERTLITAIGVGIIIALLVDAVARTH